MFLVTLPREEDLSKWCRRYGVSRQAVYRWRERFEVEGPAGLELRSRAPKRPHGRTSEGVEDAVVAARKELADLGWDNGPASIHGLLVARGGIEVVPSVSTVWRILTRRGLISPQPRKAPRRRWRRFERERPNECWQGDDTHYLLASDQEVRIINILDDCSRLNVDSLAVVQCRSPRVAECFLRGVERYGPPMEFLNDNGRAWNNPADEPPVPFQRCLADLGVRQLRCAPYHPQTCGKVERFHQTQRKWLAARPAAETIAEVQRLLDEFRDQYNHQRPHRALDRQTPAAIWTAQPAAAPIHALAGTTIQTTHRHTATKKGVVSIGRALSVGLGPEWARHTVTVLRHGTEVTVIDTETGEIIRHLTIDPTRNYQPTGRPPGPHPKM
jgi:transposase InsO family protein